MAKVKYYYDPETLSYQQIEVRKRDKFKNTVIGLIGVVLVAFLGFVVLSQFFESPKEKTTNREN